MTHATRESVVKAFHKPNSKANSPRVMLISLKAGALGLNLTCASQVFLMDPWWQASIEQQAIDRVYRLGQTRPVNVFQLVARDTVEERVLGIQEAKNRLISQAFSGSKTAFKEREKIGGCPLIACVLQRTDLAVQTHACKTLPSFLGPTSIPLLLLCFILIRFT